MLLKRILDIIISIVGLIILSPIFLIVTILIRVKMGRPVFFFQVRPGFNEKPFKIIKFRTMSHERDRNGNLLPNEQRNTKFGKLLRSYSLDEIPELINVVKGEMSLVGPRPLLMSYLPLYNEEQRRRHTVKPGITGLAQINGRNAISWEQKFEYDVRYVDTRTIWFDLKILFKTVKKVISRESITPSDSSFTEPFKGT